MTRTVIDTHVWVWAAFEPERLSDGAAEAVGGAVRLHAPTVSIYEIGQRVRTGRWPGMTRNRLETLLDLTSQPLELAPLSAWIARRASLMAWDHRDPFDRIIAATALELGAPLIPRDVAFGSCEGLERV